MTFDTFPDDDDVIEMILEQQELSIRREANERCRRFPDLDPVQARRRVAEERRQMFLRRVEKEEESDPNLAELHRTIAQELVPLALKRSLGG